MFTESAVGCDLDGRLYLIRVDHFELRDRDSWRVESNFLCIGQIAAAEDKRGVGPPLGSSRLDAAQRWRRGESSHSQEANGRENCNRGANHKCRLKVPTASGAV